MRASVSFSLKDDNFCVFTHEFEKRIVFVGYGKIEDAFTSVKFSRVLQIEILRRLGDDEHDRKTKVIVDIYQTNMTEADAKRLCENMVTALKPVWQGGFDQVAYNSLTNILCVQTGEVFPSVYAASKATGISTTSIYGLLMNAVHWSQRKGFNFVRTTRQPTVEPRPKGRPIGS